MSRTPPHIRIPNSVLDDPLYYDARLTHQAIFIRLIRLAAFKPMRHDIRGKIVDIKPGQLCYALQKIAELTGKHTSKDDVEGALRHFGEKCQFLLHEVLHKKSIITFLHPDICALFSISTPPTTPPPFLQDSSTKQTEETEYTEEQQRQAVVVFPVLETLRDSSIHRKHREEISYKYTEEVVKNAVAAITEEGFIPEHSLLKSLRAACKGGWKPKIGNDAEKNRKLAKKLEGSRKGYTFEALDKYIEIVKGMKSECIVYAMPYEKFYNQLEKVGKISIKQEIGE